MYSRASSGWAPRGLRTPVRAWTWGHLPCCAGSGADRLPGCWDKAVQGCSVFFLISRVTVFCVVSLATNYIGVLNISFTCVVNCYLTLHVVYCLQYVLNHVSIFHSTQEGLSPSQTFTLSRLMSWVEEVPGPHSALDPQSSVCAHGPIFPWELQPQEGRAHRVPGPSAELW